MDVRPKLFQTMLAVTLLLATISAQATPSTSYYIFDESGHVIGEYDQNGNPVQEHVYLGDKPVAVVQNNTTLNYVTADQLNTPRVITNSSQAVVWQWASDPHGNGQPTGSLSYNLRFPGQYYDAETGHDYNYERDYDPNTGRYIESDPIGLDGGTFSTYIYVSDNPFKHSDSTGEGFVDCAKAVAELVDATADLDRRIAEILFWGNNPDKNHVKSLKQAANRVFNALQTVKNSCRCVAGAAAAIAAAEAALEAAGPYLLVLAL